MVVTFYMLSKKKKKNSIPGCEFILLCFLLEVLAF